MSTVLYPPFLAVIILLQSYSISSNSLPPILAPLIGSVCQGSVCGKGNCVPSTSSNFGFECECENGWRQARFDNEDNLGFLPCIVPNCTLHYDCSNASPPAPSNNRGSNFSIFDPCSWTDCGGGTCNRTSLFTHTCDCEEGYYNLLNITAFPCYRTCALGLDCAHLGLGLTNTSTSRPNSSPNVTNIDDSHAGITSLKCTWWITIVTTLALRLWKDT